MMNYEDRDVTALPAVASAPKAVKNNSGASNMAVAR